MQHILKVDAKPAPKDDEEKEKALPRIIGIEGSWGSDLTEHRTIISMGCWTER